MILKRIGPRSGPRLTQPNLPAGRRKAAAAIGKSLKMYMFCVSGFLISGNWPKSSTVGKKIDELAMQQEMKRLIIERGKEDNAALEILADQRAHAVYDFIHLRRI